MSEGAHKGLAVPIAASLAEFTDKLIARRGVEQSNLLFGGQIGPAAQAHPPEGQLVVHVAPAERQS